MSAARLEGVGNQVQKALHAFRYMQGMVWSLRQDSPCQRMSLALRMVTLKITILLRQDICTAPQNTSQEAVAGLKSHVLLDLKVRAQLMISDAVSLAAEYPFGSSLHFT